MFLTPWWCFSVDILFLLDNAIMGNSTWCRDIQDFANFRAVIRKTNINLQPHLHKRSKPTVVNKIVLKYLSCKSWMYNKIKLLSNYT